MSNSAEHYWRVEKMPDRKICQFDYYWNFIHEMICNKVNVQGVKSLWGDCNVFPPVSVSGALYRKNAAIAPKSFNSLDTIFRWEWRSITYILNNFMHKLFLQFSLYSKPSSVHKCLVKMAYFSRNALFKSFLQMESRAVIWPFSNWISKICTYKEAFENNARSGESRAGAKGKARQVKAVPA